MYTTLLRTHTAWGSGMLVVEFFTSHDHDILVAEIAWHLQDATPASKVPMGPAKLCFVGERRGAAA